MAIAFDATFSGGLNASTNKLSWNHTLASDGLLIVGLFEDSGSEKVTSVVWDAAGVNQAFTKIGAAEVPSDRFVSLWILQSPSATGTKQIDINASSTIAIRGESSSFTGCSHSGQPDGSDTTTAGGSGSISGDVPVTASGCWIVAVAKGTTDGTLDTPGVIRQHGNSLNFWDTNGTVSTGTVTTTISGGGWGALVAASLAPSGGGGGSSPHSSSRMLSGMGR